jgi:hypothetical protein
MPNYIEELDNGESFILDNSKLIVTCDHKSNGNRLCIDLKTGSSRWLSGNTIIDKVQLFTLDKDNNLIAIKETIKDDLSKNSNIP